MTTATYRGVSYNVEERRMNELHMIKKQLEILKLRKDAELAMARQGK